MHKDDTRR